MLSPVAVSSTSPRSRPDPEGGPWRRGGCLPSCVDASGGASFASSLSGAPEKRARRAGGGVDGPPGAARRPAASRPSSAGPPGLPVANYRSTNNHNHSTMVTHLCLLCVFASLHSFAVGFTLPIGLSTRDRRLAVPTSPVLVKTSKSGSSSDPIAPDHVPHGGEFEAKAKAASKRQMMSFALPALGIFLANPLLSNIDNAFVGRTVGASGLAALSPATLCTDQVLYLFSFLGRATTGLVSRAYKGGPDGGDTNGAREAASGPLTVSLAVGAMLSILYACFTPLLLSMIGVAPDLVPSASSYVWWRGAIAWAALAQNCALQIFLATRDAITPLLIVASAAILNVGGDFLFCMWPLRWGCGGAAAATSAATLLSSGLMVRALKKRQLLPKIKLPSKDVVESLLEFMGPLMLITVTRLLGFVFMQRKAMQLGEITSLAAFQICINVVSFFLLFAEPLSQLSQTTLPALVDAEDGDSILANLKSILTLGLGSSVAVGGMAFFVTRCLAFLFTSDPGVLAKVHALSLTVFAMVTNAILAVTVDGAMLASRDFGFMLSLGTTTFLVQLGVLRRCTTLQGIFATFIFRLGLYGPLCAIRWGVGRGAIGKAIAKSRREKRAAKTA